MLCKGRITSICVSTLFSTYSLRDFLTGWEVVALFQERMHTSKNIRNTKCSFPPLHIPVEKLQRCDPLQSVFIHEPFHFCVFLLACSANAMQGGNNSMCPIFKLLGAKISEKAIRSHVLESPE